MVATTYVAGTGVPATQLNGDFSRCLDKSGDTMVGMLTLASDPINPLDAATKQYIDNRLSPGGAFVLKSGDTMSGTLTLNSTLAFSARANGGLPVVGGSFIGDLNKLWSTGALFGFGQRPTTTSAANDVGPILTVQRSPAYTGAISGNPSALIVLCNAGTGVTGKENGLISQYTINSASGTYTAGTFTMFKINPGTAAMIDLNVNSQDQTGRMSSVSGSNVPQENDLWASGPDDAGLRIGTEIVSAEYTSSSDGATTFYVGGFRVRGREVRNPTSGGLAAPTNAVFGVLATTQAAPKALFPNAASTGAGLTGSFTNAFCSDGATISFSAASAVQTATTSTSFTGGVTTITLTTNQNFPAYIWPGALVTGTNIAANTHVVSQSYDNVTTITVVLDTPTSGAIANNATITFTNVIGTAFSASGFITGNAFQSPGFAVNNAGTVTALGVAGTTTNNNANAGSVGEFVSSSVAITTVSMSTTVPINITSISLTAGDWDVSGVVAFNPAGTTTIGALVAGINTTSGTLPAAASGALASLLATFTAGSQAQMHVNPCRMSLAGTTTVFLVAQANFGTSTMQAGGFIRARRVR